MSSSRTTLITGAGGFIGTALNLTLTGLERRTRGTFRAQPGDESPGSIVVGNLNAHTDWQLALEGVDAVIHLAGRAHVMRDTATDSLAEYRLVNVQATAKLARDAARQGVRRLIYLSSVKVNGEHTPDNHPFSEIDTPHPEDSYGRSKLEAEQVLRGIADETGLEVIILRPPLVYGPGVKGNFLRMMRLIDRGVPLPLASINNRRSLIYIGNLVDAIITCLDAPAAAGKTFLVSDGEDVSTPNLIRKLAGAMGRPSRMLSCPPTLLRIGAALLGKRAAAMRLTGSLAVDSALIRSELGWRPRYSMDQGLNETAGWYHQYKTKGA